MATDDKEVTHECVYLGSHEPRALQPVEQRPVPPNPDFVRKLALDILGGTRGSYRPTVHFRGRMKERGFDVFDMEYVIRNGCCVETGEYSVEHRNHRYRFRGDIDGVGFDAVFALSAEHDLIKSPLMILITGCWKTKSGKRRKTY